MKYGNEFLKVRRPAVGDRGRADGVFQNQVPANDPSEQFTQGGVGIRIRRARDRHHRSKLRVAERRKDTRNPRQHKREHQRRSGAVMGRDPGQDEDTGANNCAYA